MMHASRHVIFVGLSGYAYPHTRVRCWHFARELARHPQLSSEVLSFRDQLAPQYSEVDMFGGVRDLRKLQLNARALRRLWPRREALLYVQKAHFHAAAPYLLHRLRGQPYLFDYDDYDVELSVFFRRGVFNRLLFGSADWLAITRRIAERARACVVSSSVLEEIVGGWNPRVTRIPTGVDVECFAPGEAERPRDTVRVVWTGLVWGETVWDNVCLLLRAFARARQQAPQLELQLIGGGQLWPRLTALVQRDYAGQGIHPQPWQPPGTMPAQLAAADIGALPLSQTDLWTRSKSPTKLFEYLASGLAVVASRNGEAEKVLTDGVTGVLADDEEAWSTALVQLAEDVALRRRLGTAARALAVEKYSLPVLGQQLQQVVLQLD